MPAGSNTNSSKVKTRTKTVSPEILGTDKSLGPTFKTPEWLNYRKKWEENPAKGIVEAVPLQIDLFAVDACNLKCPICPRHTAWNNDKKGYMKTETVLKILDQATEHGLQAFNFGGLGEPTIHPDIVKIIHYAKERGVVDVNVHTNGTRLNTQLSKDLIESGLDRIILSLDSADKETYEKIRVGAKFEKTYANANGFIELRNKYAYKDKHGDLRPHVKVNFVNIDENDPTQLNLFVDYWKGKANRIGVLVYLDFECYENGYEKIAHIKNYDQDPNFSCGELWSRLSIRSCGTATICSRDFNKNFAIGNIHEQTVTEIWNGEKMDHFRKLHSEGHYKKIPICKSCPNSHYCKK